jgi:hypothetical protein
MLPIILIQPRLMKTEKPKESRMKRSCARYATAEPTRTVNPLKITRQLLVRIEEGQIEPAASAIGENYLLLAPRPERKERAMPSIATVWNSGNRWNISHRSLKNSTSSACGKANAEFNPLMLTATLLDKMPES